MHEADFLDGLVYYHQLAGQEDGDWNESEEGARYCVEVEWKKGPFYEFFELCVQYQGQWRNAPCRLDAVSTCSGLLVEEFFNSTENSQTAQNYCESMGREWHTNN